MDYLEKGKNLAKNGQYEEALDALVLALENDKENPDIHFYIGLCYSSLEEFPFAKYHYQMARVLDPNHAKTNLVWEGLSHIEAKKPPEKRAARAAAAKERRAVKERGQTEAVSDDQHGNGGGGPAGKSTPQNTGLQSEEKWEAAFPTETMKVEEGMPFVQKILIFLLGVTIIGSIGYFVYQTLF